MESYSALAFDYDNLTQDVDYGRMADYIIKAKSLCLAKECSALLDAGCGSGSLLEQLSGEFETLIGVDQSEEMLQQAFGRAWANPPLLLCQPLEELDLYGTVQMAVSTLDTLNHILEEETLAEVLRRISLFLEPGGLFLFDVNSLYKHQTILGDNVFVDETEDCFCVWENHYLPETHTTELLINLFDRDEKGYVRRTEQFAERCWLTEELLPLLEQVHLEVLEVCDDYSAAPVGEQTQRITFLTRKKMTKSGGQVDETEETEQ